MTKRRKKGSDKQARDQRLFANVRVWVWEAEPPDDSVSDFVLHVQKKVPFGGWANITDHALVDNLFERSRNWIVCGRALVRHPTDEWMEQAYMTLPSCRLLQVKGAYEALRKEVLAANQLRHVYDCGWVAQTWLGKDPSDVDPEWMYHDGPPELAPKKIAGLGYMAERHERWQMVNEREAAKHENN